MSSVLPFSGSLPCSTVAPVSGSISPYAPWLPLSLTTTRRSAPSIVSHVAPEASGTGGDSANGSASQAVTAAEPSRARTTGAGTSEEALPLQPQARTAIATRRSTPGYRIHLLVQGPVLHSNRDVAQPARTRSVLFLRLYSWRGCELRNSERKQQAHRKQTQKQEVLRT